MRRTSGGHGAFDAHNTGAAGRGRADICMNPMQELPARDEIGLDHIGGGTHLKTVQAGGVGQIPYDIHRAIARPAETSGGHREVDIQIGYAAASDDADQVSIEIQSRSVGAIATNIRV